MNRDILVGHRMNEAGCQVGYIHADGFLESHGEMENRMFRLQKSPAADLFRSRPGDPCRGLSHAGRKVCLSGQRDVSGFEGQNPLGAHGFYVNE